MTAAYQRFVLRARRVAAGLLAAAPLACPGGYLPKVGPAPLRHAEDLPRVVRVPATVVTIHPAAPAGTGTPGATNTPAGAAETAAFPDAPEAIVLTAKSPLPWFDWLTPVTPPPARPPAAPSEDVAAPHSELTPQSMIPFFQTRTSPGGAREVSTWGAVTFTPPVPGQRPESKASFPAAPPPAPAPTPAAAPAAPKP